MSNMSRDIRAPMNAIIGFFTIAVSHIDNKDQVMDCLQKVLSSGNHLLSLINDIPDTSRIESGKAQIKEIVEMMNGTISVESEVGKGDALLFHGEVSALHFPYLERFCHIVHRPVHQ